MRSRYCAYYLHNADYIIKTTHEQNIDFTDDTQQWKKEILDFTSNYKFEKLTIIEFIENDKRSYVTFHAKITHDAKDYSFTEKSAFEKKNHAWLYLEAVNI
ncbi:hypothetical protein ALC152_10390 [Arcobacter sp. 15-2]|uniref:YchJ family metal-binding protein n=1 Tax=Arcobacter sp. 15-2 TaxID=3374109 RepID=UPI00399C7D46